MDRLARAEPDPMIHDEKALLRALGARIAQFGKDSTINQVRLAQANR